MTRKKDNISDTFISNINFYNEVANSYNSILDKTESNNLIRQKTAAKFCSVVDKGWVMDFGGGTGLDMEWLIINGYKIFFCEPSQGMRQEAINHFNINLQNSNVIFLEGCNTDFISWKETMPVFSKVNGILANFGVINNISNLHLLFKNFNRVLIDEGHVILLALDEHYGIKNNRNVLRHFFDSIFKKPVSFFIHQGEHKQIVYLHTIRQIQESSEQFFRCCSIDDFKESGFILIHLEKK